MSEVLKQPAVLGAPGRESKEWALRSYLPAVLAVGGAVALTLLRMQTGGERFIGDVSLMMIALACYLTAAVFHLTSLYAPAPLFRKLGLWAAGLGVFFNLASWGVRWVAAYDREWAIHSVEGTPMPWVWRYIPFANLYDLSLAFAFGAGITTLLIAHRESFRFLGAVSLPMAALILVLARFIGGDFINLPPVLDSYWRPIHVGIASLSYGIALVCFAVAVVYLLKDGVKTEAMAVWAAIFAFLVFATVSRGTVFWAFDPGVFATYRATTFLPPRFPLPLRADIPHVGLFLMLAGVALVGVVIAFCVYLYGKQQSEAARRWGHHLLKASLVLQAAAIVLLVWQVKTLPNVALCDGARPEGTACINPQQFRQVGAFLAEQEKLSPEQIASIPAARLEQAGAAFIRERQGDLFLSLNANPVELAALITAFAATLFVIIFSFRTEQLRAALPSREKIDSLMYKTAGVSFAGLALLLMTGAIWANESWGRYWGWDSKETGAFVAWLTYGAFLHSRIARGWTGRSSAYFAIVAFLLVIFTYLGVSYLLPGLHSYA
jgi:ABC-type transport system involved in cytochrome c biogenesis permease subunit